jgi:PAS domain S-box-containing protein
LAFDHLFSRLKDNPRETIKLQYAYKTREGNYIWLESTASNGFGDAEINGYLLQTVDITARRLEEQANRMRSKIQALSENSPDLIIRLEGGRITYINPVIEYYTGKNAVAFLNKKTRESGLDPVILESWSRIVDQVSQSGGKMILEMDFPTTVGLRIMQVHAIPEYDENSTLESVLVVSHDITERKKIETELHYQHRRITESINYAKRIQGAILPNPRLIDRALPESFILYKPRDLVSGDFPWFAQVKDDIFMAAVDCTGHGVPGALLSLVGYFLLNDIVRSRRITDPGRILDLLDEGVSTTLRPDEDAGTKDGMDISLCRINLEQKEVAYAGAHRPLYVMRNGLLEEVKGNKFPIGGGIFKNQTNFTSSTLKLNHGDSIFFCSDGFCDQFGGPKGRKFGTRQLRDIIAKVNTIPMKEARAIFEDQWETWRGDQKQTDDVLLIGIRF